MPGADLLGGRVDLRAAVLGKAAAGAEAAAGRDVERRGDVARIAACRRRRSGTGSGFAASSAAV